MEKAFALRPPLPSGLSASHGKRPRVCIATADLVGPIRNGGVGTACTTLAEALADAGQDVSVLYVGPFEAGDAATWTSHYRQKGISFHVPAEGSIRLEGDAHARASYLAYEWLKRQPRFDVIQFPEINGVGFYSLQAKRLGLAFSSTHLCVVLHSPTLWHRSENKEPVCRVEDLVLDFMERECVARADSLVSPTRYLLSWAVEWGFQPPAHTYVQPYVSPAPRARQLTARRPIAELVFFGRLESRKGLELFCDALDILDGRGMLHGIAVTFLGKIGRAGGLDGATLVRRRTAHLDATVTLETTLGQPEAIAYLRARQALAVMPSLADNMPYAVLECLAEGIPFVAVASGGIPEMIAAEDHRWALAEPEPSALATLLERALRDGADVVRNAVDPNQIRMQWIQWHELLAGSATETPAASQQPLPRVSVCVATRNRPALLHSALETLRAQTYPNFEVVLVDDGSDSAPACDYLGTLTAEFAERRWTIVRRSEPGHPGAARNTAAAHAQGEYLLFMDDDNLARPHEIEMFVNAARHSGLTLLTCVFDHFRHEADTATAPESILRWLPLGSAVVPGMWQNYFGDTNMLVRRDVFLELGGFDEDRASAFIEDWLFLSRAALAGVEIAVLPEPLFWYRVWDGAHGQKKLHGAGLHRRLATYLSGESPERRALTMFSAGLYERAKAVEGTSQIKAAQAAMLATRFASSRPGLTIGPTDLRLLKAEQEVEIAPAADGILLRSSGRDPIVWLPSCPPPHVHSIVRIDFSAPQATCLQLFWSTRRTPYPCEAQSVLVPAPEGRHTLWAEIPAASHTGRLRLDPSFAPGDYILHHFESRSESDDVGVAESPIASMVSRLYGGPQLLLAAEHLRQAWSRLRRGKSPLSSAKPGES